MKRLLPVSALAFALATGVTAAAPACAQERPAASSSQPIPYKKEEAGTGAAAGQSIAILAVLLGVAWGALVLAKRYLPQLGMNLPLPLTPNAARRLRVLETVRLGPRASLYLVQLDQKTLLLVESGNNITVAVAGIDGGTDNKDTDVA